jgi:hypothetical protein
MLRLGVYGIIILKWILKKWDNLGLGGIAWTVFIWLRLEKMEGLV